MGWALASQTVGYFQAWTWVYCIPNRLEDWAQNTYWEPRLSHAQPDQVVSTHHMWTRIWWDAWSLSLKNVSEVSLNLPLLECFQAKICTGEDWLKKSSRGLIEVSIVLIFLHLSLPFGFCRLQMDLILSLRYKVKEREWISQWRWK